MFETVKSVPPEELAKELEPVVDRLFARHLSNAAEWYPHEFVPWSEGRNYEPNEVWDPEEYKLDEGVRSAIFVNLLTEDNLPYYTQTLLGLFGMEHPFHNWVQRWTAEENRHSIVLRNWVEIERPIDPRALEDARMAQMSKGEVPRFSDALQAIAYVCLQESATQIAHRNTSKHLLDSSGKRIMGRIAGDEALHYKFYRDLGGAVFEIDSSAMMTAVAKQVRSFAMPGTGIVDFSDHQARITESSIYDAAKFKEGVVEPTLEYWGVWDKTGLSAEAEQSRQSIEKRLRALGHIANRK